MSDFIVIREFHGAFNGNVLRFPEAKILSDEDYDIDQLQAAGVRMVPFTAGTLDRILRGDGSLGNAVAALVGDGGFTTNVLLVDAGTTLATASQDGTSDRKFKTIQQAIDLIPEGIDAASARRVNVIGVVGGDYDEDLDFDVTGRRIMLVSLGPWNLGKFDNNGWQPSADPRRNVTVSGDLAPVNLIRCYFGLFNLIEAGRRDLAPARNSGPRISGQVIVDAVTTIPLVDVLEMDLEAEIYGDTGNTAGISLLVSDGTGIRLRTTRSSFRGKIVCGSTAALSDVTMDRCHQTRFRADVLINGYGLFQECDFEGANFEVDPTLDDSGLNGFVNCQFESAYNGNDNPDGAMRLDGYTQAAMLRTGGSVVNAVKVFRDAAATLTYAAGAVAPTTDQYLEANASAISGTPGALGLGRRGPAPKDGTLNLLVWDSDSADNTTEVVINVGGVDTVVTLTGGVSGQLELGAQGLSPILQSQVAGGALVGVRWNGNGTDPGNLAVAVYQQ